MSFIRGIVFLFITLFIMAGATHRRVDAQAAGVLDPSLLGTMHWRSIGPANTGGRIDDVAVARVPGQPDAIYAATASRFLIASTR